MIKSVRLGDEAESGGGFIVIKEESFKDRKEVNENCPKCGGHKTIHFDMEDGGIISMHCRICPKCGYKEQLHDIRSILWKSKCSCGKIFKPQENPAPPPYSSEIPNSPCPD